MLEQAALSCEPFGPCKVTAVRGTEAMNALPVFHLDVLSEDGAVDLAAVVRSPATLALADGSGAVRETRLIVMEAAHAAATRDGHRYALTLSSPLALLGLRSGYRIFQDMTSQEIAARLLADAGQGGDVAYRLQGRYGKRVYTAQYGESELAFFMRLLADDGINFWLEDEGDRTLLVLGDGDASHGGIPGDETLRFEDASGMAHTTDSFHELRRVARLCHDRVSLLDFDIRQPDVLIEGQAGTGPMEHYEHPACVLNADAAAARARSRLEQLQRRAVTLQGMTTCVRLSPGRVVRIEGAADAWFEGQFLVTAVAHALTQASRDDAAKKSPYSCTATLAPFGRGRAFRPELPPGPRTAIIESVEVTGPPGEEIHTDDLGRVKVRFRWDRSGIADDRSSLWIRHLQMNMGGSMLLPRVGWELPVLYEEGNPDRPVALGRLYNGGAPTPYSMPGRKATSTLQTATSPADGTTHELRFADDGGQQETFIHATKDQTVFVGGSHSVDVAANRTDDVKKSAELGIKADQTRTVGGSQSVTVGADAVFAVKGARTESIGGSEDVGVTGTYITNVKGAYSETVGGAYALQCNQSNTTVQGSFTQMVGGAMITTAGLGTNQSVAAARTEAVGGARAIHGASVVADQVKGIKTVTAGAASDAAGSFISTNAAGISIEVGSAASISAGGMVFVKGAWIDIQAGTLAANGGTSLSMSGGVSASGPVELDAPLVEKPQTSITG